MLSTRLPLHPVLSDPTPRHHRRFVVGVHLPLSRAPLGEGLLDLDQILKSEGLVLIRRSGSTDRSLSLWILNIGPPRNC